MSVEEIDSREEFEHWLAAMDDNLDDFLSSLPREVRAQLDYTPGSLDVIEEWILKTYPDTYSMLPMDQSKTVNGLACYIGETYRKTRGGTWDIRLDDPDYVYHGLPIIVPANPNGVAECPLSVATASADRRTGKFIRSLLENWD